jgi:hypothetical protein
MHFIFCIPFCFAGESNSAHFRQGFRMIPSPDSLPRLAPGCYVNDKKENPRLLIKDGKSLRLHGPSLEIVERCDGLHTVKQIISELQLLYSKAEPSRVEQDVLNYLSLLSTQNYLDL